MSCEFHLGGLQVCTLPKKLSGLPSLPKGPIISMLGCKKKKKKIELASGENEECVIRK